MESDPVELGGLYEASLWNDLRRDPEDHDSRELPDTQDIFLRQARVRE